MYKRSDIAIGQMEMFFIMINNKVNYYSNDIEYCNTAAISASGNNSEYVLASATFMFIKKVSAAR
jgi:hypothetical protein